jgi:predicted nuclease of predicted toxin-antitoxin system
MPALVKVDEDLPGEVATILGAAGHDARTVYEQGHSGLADKHLWPIVQDEGRMLLTADKGFADARVYPPGTHAGVVLFRLPRESRAGYCRLVEFMVSQTKLEDLAGAVAIVSPGAIRVLRA